jgi:hypothetical protein
VGKLKPFDTFSTAGVGKLKPDPRARLDPFGEGKAHSYDKNAGPSEDFPGRGRNVRCSSCGKGNED